MIVETEQLLAEWFGRPVVLCSSGRVALKLVLEHAGFDRYRDQFRVPPYLSRCVLGAVTHHAFPVLKGTTDGVLVYHQYGFPQIGAPRRSLIVEDIAHAFYATAQTGKRTWLGHAAIFSLPKWFQTAGPCGGIIVATDAEADALRERVIEAPKPDWKMRTWMRQAFQAGEGIDDLLYRYPGPDPESLGGMPTTIQEIQKIGVQRAERVRMFRETIPNQPEALWAGVAVPWAIPCFLPSEALTRAYENARMAVYHVDVARNMNHPRYRPCHLLPAHQWVEESAFRDLCQLMLACV